MSFKINRINPAMQFLDIYFNIYDKKLFYAEIQSLPLTGSENFCSHLDVTNQ